MHTLTFWHYFKLNRKTTVSCLKICSILFTGIATAIALGVKYTKGAEEDPLVVFIACELFGHGFALFIFLLAIFEGFSKAKIVLKQFDSIPHRKKEEYGLEVIQRPLNSKFWFMQFVIISKEGEEFTEA